MGTDTRFSANILIIDDDSQVRNLLRSILLQNGYLNVYTISTATEALSQFSTLSPDYTFLDINLPDINGLNLLTQLLEINQTAKIVMISADSSFSNVKTSLDSGAKGFIVKPFSIQKILNSLQF